MYPALWAHNANRERHLVVNPDKQGRIRSGYEAKAAKIWSTASCLHFNLEFGTASQSLSACLTPMPTIGGRAWPSFMCDDKQWEKSIVLWMNTTLGLISFWWNGTRQHPGRSIVSISRIPQISVLDMKVLSKRKGWVEMANGIFEAFEEKTFLPANEAYRDDNRKALDEAVLIDLLGLPKTILEPLDLLRNLWCEEPSVHGGKSTRPGGKPKTKRNSKHE